MAEEGMKQQAKHNLRWNKREKLIKMINREFDNFEIGGMIKGSEMDRVIEKTDRILRSAPTDKQWKNFIKSQKK